MLLYVPFKALECSRWEVKAEVSTGAFRADELDETFSHIPSRSEAITEIYRP